MSVLVTDSASRTTPMKREEALKRLRRIPAFPAAARKLMSMVSSENGDLRAISEVLKSEAVLAGETLRMANSALFALRHEVTSVLHAVSVLGLDRLKSVVITVGLRDMMKNRTELSQRCWRHNLACALVAEAAADACGLERASAYTAALLHGVGSVGLASCFGDEFATALSAAAAMPEQSLLEHERKHIGMTHVEAAEWLIHHWELPDTFLATSRCDHGPAEPVAPGSLAGLANLACEAADCLGFSIASREETWDANRFLDSLPERSTTKLSTVVRDLPEVIPYKINDFEMSFLR